MKILTPLVISALVSACSDTITPTADSAPVDASFDDARSQIPDFDASDPNCPQAVPRRDSECAGALRCSYPTQPCPARPVDNYAECKGGKWVV